MQKVLLDSNIISYFLRGEPFVITELGKYQQSYEQITFSVLTYYEIISGLKYRDSKKILTIFEELASESEILEFNQDTAKIGVYRLYYAIRKGCLSRVGNAHRHLSVWAMR